MERLDRIQVSKVPHIDGRIAQISLRLPEDEVYIQLMNMPKFYTLSLFFERSRLERLYNGNFSHPYGSGMTRLIPRKISNLRLSLKLRKGATS